MLSLIKEINNNSSSKTDREISQQIDSSRITKHTSKLNPSLNLSLLKIPLFQGQPLQVPPMLGDSPSQRSPSSAPSKSKQSFPSLVRPHVPTLRRSSHQLPSSSATLKEAHKLKMERPSRMPWTQCKSMNRTIMSTHLPTVTGWLWLRDLTRFKEHVPDCLLMRTACHRRRNQIRAQEKLWGWFQDLRGMQDQEDSINEEDKQTPTFPNEEGILWDCLTDL